MEIRANCKINLGLNIVERRKDGYHNIETVFYPVPLADTLQVTPSEHDALQLEGVPVDGPTEDNLVMRVVRKLRQFYPIPPLHVVLRKNVPVGAGLGGGSSDAAHMLKLLNTEFRLGLSEQQ
ncbi:MAG: 4-(cytidine 5'-diphospho)-2-C-methyl-D-erythritol kinase, partial [Bacteroidaceae bacterium]|nr:4-(cytidine 5'-diphospho)-2-C-methyl-D-erythritol kinase [Bacteroidaceae bacterium]